MFIKSDIRKVTIALEKDLAHESYVRLGRAGIIHLGRIQAGDGLAVLGSESEEWRVRDILAGCAFVSNALQIEAGEAIVSEKIRDLDQDDDLVSGAKRTIERLQRLRTRIREEAAFVAKQLEYAEALAGMGIDPGAIRKTRLIRTVFGRITEPASLLPAHGPFLLTGAGSYVFGAALPEALPQMLEYLKQRGVVDQTADVRGVSPESLKKRESSLQRRLDFIDKYMGEFREKMGPALKELHQSYKGFEEVIKAMRLAGSSVKVMFITGWIDFRDRHKLLAILKEVCGERFIVSCERDRGAPVRLRNIRLLKPFELLVRTMGMPANSEIDPTPLAAVTFVIIFGLMFGDLGQGLVLSLVGLLLRHFAKKKQKEDIGHAGGILVACGLSAAFCGVLYGSLFSSEHLIPALWMSPAGNIMGLFAVTILLGAVIIMIGLCVNIINSLSNADYAEALLEKNGMAVLIPYGAIVFMVVRYALHRQVPATWEIQAFVVLPLAIFSLRGVLVPVLFKGAWPHDIAEYITETVMGLVEIALSMFANTVSFIRVGAFALSHAGLSIVTYTLAGLADPSLKSPAAIAVIVAGNIFIIGFEGMICIIQSMRLEYYEFFSKFFKGSGLEFSPFVLKTKLSEV